MVVPILSLIGMGLGISLWGTISIIIGWATSRFGLLGLAPTPPTHSAMNYIGVALILCSTIFYVNVKPELNNDSKPKDDNDDNQRDIPNPIQDDGTILDEDTRVLINDSSTQPQKVQFMANSSSALKMLVGATGAAISGLLYGNSYNPMNYIIANYENASRNELDYVFAFDTGILITSIILFMIYCVVKKNKPIINEKLVLPGILGGLMWGIANVSFFQAANQLSQAITYPIGASGPTVVSNLVAILIFKEIRGLRNLLILGTGFVFTLSGIILVAMSK
jgi:uncharacterized membrane protein